MRTRVESIDETVARLTGGIEEAAAKAQQTQAEFETVQSRVGELDAGEVGLDEHHDRTVAALRLADERVAELQAAERGAERQVASLRARIEALSVGLDRKDGAAWLQRNHGGAGLFGSIANLVKVRPGYEAAIAAVLGAAADAVAAENFGAARSAVAALKAVRRRPRGHRAGRLAAPTRRAPTGPLPDGALWALDLVEARRRGCRARSPPCCPASRWCATSPPRWIWSRRARSCARSPPTVTSSGRAGSAAARTASPARWRSPRRSRRPAPSWPPPRSRPASCRAALSGALAEQAARQDAAEQALAALNESDAAISAIYEQLGRLGQDARAADDEWQRLIQQRDELEAGRDADRRGTRRTRAAAAQRPAGSRRSKPNPSTARQSMAAAEAGPRRRGGGAACGAHRRGTRECRSRTGGFAAPRGGRRTRGPAARAARARGTRTRRGGRGGGGRVRPRLSRSG